MTSTTRNLIIIAGIFIALVAWKYFISDSSNEIANASDSRNNKPAQQISVEFVVVQPESFSERVQTVGTILSNEEVEIRSEISGKIEKILFTEGTKVNKGDVLIKINDDELQARLLSAQSRLKLAEQQQERQHQLFEKNLLSQQEFDGTINELNVVKAEVQLVKAQLDKTEIFAPFDGNIGLRYVSEGSYLSPTTIITTLQDYSTVKIDFTFPEKYSSEIKNGDKIFFTVQGTTKKFSGSVYAIAPKIDPATRTLRIRAASPNSDGDLVPGGFANVEVQLQAKESLTIPSYAVIPELKRHKVFVCENGKAIERVIELGNRGDERVEVVQGLQAGDTIITSALLQLRSGMDVRPLQK
ncbi:MAG: efflux RND transporter periplasmic adaptor subunit [Ignavibacteriae bacterium]|nr:efflux RND transporter periplasmic adaptor subunit [Ignavibacteriota bacterium]